MNSSAIASVGYDSDTFVLEIEFRSGTVYRSFAVPPDVHSALMAAESIGEYYAQSIRDRYPYVKEEQAANRDRGSGFRGI